MIAATEAWQITRIANQKYLEADSEFADKWINIIDEKIRTEANLGRSMVEIFIGDEEFNSWFIGINIIQEKLNENGFENNKERIERRNDGGTLLKISW